MSDGLFLFSSDDLWKGIQVSEYRLPSMNIQEEQPERGHRIAFNMGRPVSVKWRPGHTWQYKVYPKGGMGIVPAGEFNRIGWEGELSALVISVDPVYLQGLFERTDIRPYQQRGIRDAMAYELAVAFRTELPFERLAGRVYGESLAAAFAIHFATTYADKPVAAAPKGKLSATQLRSVIEYCRDLPNQDPGLENLARQAHVSVFHFIRQFRRTMGMTPHQYILRQRIERAQQLIREDSLSLTDIAHRLGFTDQAHFSRAFRKACGCSPREFGK